MYISIYSDHSEIWMCFNDWWRVFWMVKDVPKKALNSQFLWFCKKKKKIKKYFDKIISRVHSNFTLQTRFTEDFIQEDTCRVSGKSFNLTF